MCVPQVACLSRKRAVTVSARCRIRCGLARAGSSIPRWCMLPRGFRSIAHPTIAPRYCPELLRALAPAERTTSALTKGSPIAAVGARKILTRCRRCSAPSAIERAGSASAEVFLQRVWAHEVMRGPVARNMPRGDHASDPHQAHLVATSSSSRLMPRD